MRDLELIVYSTEVAHMFRFGGVLGFFQEFIAD